MNENTTEILEQEELDLLEAEDTPEEEEGGQPPQPAEEQSPAAQPPAPNPPKRQERSPELELLDLYARQSGMTRRQYVEQLQQSHRQNLEAQERQRLSTLYPDAPVNLVQEIAGITVRQKEQDARQRMMEQEQTNRQRQREPWERFFQQNPTAEVEKLPPALWERVAAGEDPATAWLAIRLEEKEAELASARQQQDTRRRSPGPVGSDAKEEEHDGFLAGLFN